MSDFSWEPLHPRANKEHVCGECLRNIGVGETYGRMAGVVDDHIWSALVCTHCEAVAEYMFRIDDEVCYGEIADSLEQYAESYREFRYLLGIRKKWTRKDGTLMRIPT